MGIGYYDVEFQFQSLNTFIRVNDILADTEEEAFIKGAQELQENTGINVEELADKNKAEYWLEVVNFVDEEEYF